MERGSKKKGGWRNSRRREGRVEGGRDGAKVVGSRG